MFLPRCYTTQFNMHLIHAIVHRMEFPISALSFRTFLEGRKVSFIGGLVIVSAALRVHDPQQWTLVCMSGGHQGLECRTL